jgi:uncharacterized protein YkwD
MKIVVFKADSFGMARRAVRLVPLVAVILFVASLVSPAGASVSNGSSSMRSLEGGILTEINSLRREHGLVPLRLSSSLSLAARQHSTEMAARGYFSHSSANGSRFDRRIAGFYPMGSRHYWSVGENLLWSSPDVDAPGALQMWLDSPEHRRNMLTARWREIGISAVHAASAPGTYSGREVTIVTTDFGVRR